MFKDLPLNTELYKEQPPLNATYIDHNFWKADLYQNMELDKLLEEEGIM